MCWRCNLDSNVSERVRACRSCRTRGLGTMTLPEDPLWWRDAVVYQMYVRSFADANTDGIGDLAGITGRLGYVAALGVDAIWLTPFYPSPQRDHGYDVADYFGVEPAYGTLDDFDRLVAECHRHGLRVLGDIVPNHCSDEHQWFRDALSAGPGSAERARFYFRDGRGENGELPPNNWLAAFGGPAWTRVCDGQWYLHTFTTWQPDFNWDNADVVEMFDTVLRFWFDRGIDGFRVDAVTHLGKAPGLPDAPPLPPGTRETDAAGRNPYSLYWPSGHDVWRHWRQVTDRYERDHPGRHLAMVAEAYTANRPDVLLQYVRPDEFHQVFSFDLMLAPWHPSTLRRAIDQTYTALGSVGASMTWALNNHDSQRSVTRYGRADATDPDSWTGNNLVYHDVAVDVVVGTARARAASVLLAGLPGSIYLYQGEELGLQEVLDLPAEARTDPIYLRTEGRELGRDGCRVPLPWTTDPVTGYGFSAGPSRPWLPQPEGWGRQAVAVEAADDDAMLALYRTVLAARAALPAGDETLTWQLPELTQLVAFSRAGVLVVLNATGVEVHLDRLGGPEREVVLSSRRGHSDPGVVPPDTCVWIRPVG